MAFDGHTNDGHKKATGQWKIVLFLLVANEKWFCFSWGVDRRQKGLPGGADAPRDPPANGFSYDYYQLLLTRGGLKLPPGPPLLMAEPGRRDKADHTSIPLRQHP